jgi:hypothetical protein
LDSVVREVDEESRVLGCNVMFLLLLLFKASTKEDSCHVVKPWSQEMNKNKGKTKAAKFK